jgi:oligopeptidase B
VTVVDPYAWLDDLEDPAVLAHLAEETTYADEQTEHLRPLRERIVAEISSRTLQTDLSVPDYDVDECGRSWWYFARTVEGQDYASYRRAPAPSRDDVPDMDRPIEGEMLLIDLNAEAAGHEVFAVGDVDVSPSGDLLLWTCDTAGDELYRARFRDLVTGEALSDVLEDVASVCWIDDRHVAYTLLDESWRPYLLRRHTLGTPVAEDVDMLREDDERFWLSAGRSGDDRWLVVDSASKASSEVHLLDVSTPTAAPILVAPRAEGVEYSVEPAGEQLFIIHNRTHRDFELAVAPALPRAWRDWQTVVAGEDGVRMLDVTAYADHLVLHLRTDGLPRVMVFERFLDGSAGSARLLDANAGLESVGAADQHYRSDRLRLHRESYVDPATVLEASWEGTDERILKRQPVLPDPQGRPYRPEDYLQQRLWALADDGVHVPVSVVSRRDTPWPAPCVLYGYGAYETSLDPGFSVARLSLLDRGVVVAYAHVRGGGELGRAWYEQGRLAAKRTTFTDFVAVGRHLVDSCVAAPGHLAARGASAGGLTVGAALNLAPELFRAAQVGVGFLDPLTAMLAEDLPLTIT